MMRDLLREFYATISVWEKLGPFAEHYCDEYAPHRNPLGLYAYFVLLPLAAAWRLEQQEKRIEESLMEGESE